MYAENELHKHYVSVIDGARYGLLLGPFASRREAEAHVEEGRQLAYSVNSDAHWYGYGTCRVTLRPGQTAKQGRLNHLAAVSS